MRSAAPATRQAAGAPSAWSQPSQSTHVRPRRWCDAGPLGRHSVTTAQKAGVEETNHGGPFPGSRLQRDSPIALSESAPSNDVWARNGTRSGTVRHPKIGLRRHVRSRPIPRTLQANIPRSFEARRRGASRTRGKPPPIGVPGMTLCRNDLAATRRAPHKVHAGLPRGARYGLLLRLRGRPPACHRRGRSPQNQPTCDHADGATLGRWDNVTAGQKAGDEVRLRDRGSDSNRDRIRGRDRTYFNGPPLISFSALPPSCWQRR
jgi:hypothetical protein